MAERITSLPAVPTLDWASRAAACLTPLGEGSIVCVMIVTMGANSVGRTVEVCGCASHASRPHDSLDTLSTRACQLTNLGPLHDAKRLPVMVLASDPVAPSHPLLALMGEAAAGGLLVGQIPLSDQERTLLVLAAPARARAGELAELSGVLPVLSRRAKIALASTEMGPGNWLTQREQSVLEALTQGHSVKQIAEQLSRSPHTIHDHVKSLHRKLNATSRGGLIARALGHMGPQGAVSAPIATPAASELAPLRLVDAKPLPRAVPARAVSLDRDALPRAV